MFNLLGFLSLLSLSVPGFLLARKILGPSRTVESLGLGFLLGSGLFTLILFGVNVLFGIQLNLAVSWVVLILVTLGLLYGSGPVSVIRFGNLRGWLLREKIVLALIAWLLASSLFTSFSRAVTDWDAVTLFDYRARIIMTTGRISDTLTRSSYLAYPLETSLLHYWAYINGLWTAMPVYPLFLIFFSWSAYCLFSGLLKNRFWSLLGVLFFLVSPKIYEQSAVAYTNMPYAGYLILGAGYLFLWTRTRSRRDLLMGVLLSVMSLWIRIFPFALVNLALIPLYWSQRPKTRIGILSVYMLVFFLSALIPGVDTLWPVLAFLKWSVVEYFSPYLLIFGLLLVTRILRRHRGGFWLVVISGYLGILVIGTHFMSVADSEWLKNPDAIRRMFMFINLAVIWLGYEAAFSL